jgi:Ribosomal protein S8
MTDPIADMLTRIRNAIVARHKDVEIPQSKEKLAIAGILLKEGYIKGFTKIENPVQNTLLVELKYVDDKNVITGLERVSKPGLRIYSGVADLPKVLNGMGIAIVSTSKGVMSDREAREQHIGGEVLAYVW